MRRVLVAGTMLLSTLVGPWAPPAAVAAPSSASERAELVDFNGDSLDDLAIGAPGEDLGARAGAGAVNVQYGSPAGLAGNGQVLTQGTPEAGDGFGAALVKGRFNDDDFVDLAVGAPAEDLGRTDAAGVVTVFYGSASGLTGPGDILQQTSPENGDAFGSTLDSGDFNADGVDDLAVGAPGEAIGLKFGMGAIAVFLGQSGGITPGSPRTVTQREAGGAEKTGDQFGSALAAGLYNGDDFYDLAVGAPGEAIGTVADAGAVSTMHGSAGGLSGTVSPLFQGDNGLGDLPERGDRFGQTLAKGIFSNNFTDDPFDDLAVGVALDDVGDRPDAGLVSLLQGSPAGLQGAGTVYFQGADLGGGAGVGGVAEAGDLLGAAVE
jgi:hypothetical protein